MRHKILWDFEILTDHPIPTRRPDLVIKKRTCRIVDSHVSADHRVKIKESKKTDKYLDLARELKKILEHEGDGGTNCNWCTWNDLQSLSKGAGRVGNRQTNRDHLNYRIMDISQNTEKSPGDLL